MISERDILGTQLVRRNDELALLYEKIKIQQSTLNKGKGSFVDPYTDNLWNLQTLFVSLFTPVLSLPIVSWNWFIC